MDKYRPCPSIIAMFTSDSQHPPRSRHAVYLGVYGISRSFITFTDLQVLNIHVRNTYTILATFGDISLLQMRISIKRLKHILPKNRPILWNNMLTNPFAYHVCFSFI